MWASRPGVTQQALLERARRGDERAYRDLVEVHRAELHAHCYRMLASVQDAEDAVQEALVRAWRGLPNFEGRSSVRTWLFRIATNTALSTAQRRSRRELPTGHGPPASLGQSSGAPLAETMWLEPYPDQFFQVADGRSSPEARYELRESVELAFVAALQDLPAQQRAVLILREVMGFGAAEVAEFLGTTVAAVNSALQRARAKLDQLLPARSQQTELRSLGAGEARHLAQRYCHALETADIDGLLAMLVEEATWSMPPLPTWYRGRQAIEAFVSREVFRGPWRHFVSQANGQLAVGCYTLDEEQRSFVASTLDVLTLDGGRIAQVTAFITSELLQTSGQRDERFVGAEAFPRFGLPARLDPEGFPAGAMSGRH
jgi:RNA polymerase sigma-70 factor (ECF subfamily)